jgi:hypothetical protein
VLFPTPGLIFERKIGEMGLKIGKFRQLLKNVPLVIVSCRASCKANGKIRSDTADFSTILLRIFPNLLD